MNKILKRAQSTHEERDRLFHKITAKNYDHDIVDKASIYHNIFFETWISQIKNGVVLDYGCGTGCLVQRILPHAKKYCGIDHSNEMLEIAWTKFRSESDKITFIQGNCLKLPFTNEKFDAIVCSGVFHHVSDAEQGIDEVLRVSKHGAKIYISEPTEPYCFIMKLKRVPYSILMKFKRFLTEDKTNIQSTQTVEKPLNRNEFLKLLDVKNIKYHYVAPVWIPLPKYLARILINFFLKINVDGDMVFIYVIKL